MISTYAVRDGRLVEKEDGEVVVASHPSPEEKNILEEKYLVGSSDIHAAVNPHEVGRMEAEDGNVFIIVKAPKHYSENEKMRFKISSLGIFLANGRLIVVSRDDAPLFDHRDHHPVSGTHGVLIKIIYTTIRHYSIFFLGMISIGAAIFFFIRRSERIWR